MNYINRRKFLKKTGKSFTAAAMASVSLSAELDSIGVAKAMRGQTTLNLESFTRSTDISASLGPCFPCTFFHPSRDRRAYSELE